MFPDCIPDVLELKLRSHQNGREEQSVPLGAMGRATFLSFLDSSALGSPSQEEITAIARGA